MGKRRIGSFQVLIYQKQVFAFNVSASANLYTLEYHNRNKVLLSLRNYIIYIKIFTNTFSSPSYHITPFGYAPVTAYSCPKCALYPSPAWYTRYILHGLTLATKHRLYFDKFRETKTAWLGLGTDWWHLVMFMHKNNIIRLRKWQVTLGFEQEAKSGLLDESPVCLSLHPLGIFTFCTVCSVMSFI